MGGVGRVGDTDGVNSNDAPETKTTDALGGAGGGGVGRSDGPDAPGPAPTPGAAAEAAGTVSAAPDAGSAVNAPDAVGGATASVAAEAGSTAAGIRDVSGAADTTSAGAAASAPEEIRAGDSEGVDDTAASASTPQAPGAADATPTRRLFWSTLGVAVALLLGDQVSKWWAVGALGDSRSIDVIGDFIRFWLVYNPGAAFSMGTGVTWIFTIFAGVAVVAIASYAWRVRSTPWAYALGLLLGGATSHFGDRLFREPAFGRGHVVDFIDYGGFFVGNVADIGIFAGAVTIVVLSFRGIEAVEPARPAKVAEDDGERSDLSGE